MDGSTIQDYISRMERADTYSSKASLFSNLVEDLFGGEVGVTPAGSLLPELEGHLIDERGTLAIECGRVGGASQVSLIVEFRTTNLDPLRSEELVERVRDQLRRYVYVIWRERKPELTFLLLASDGVHNFVYRPSLKEDLKRVDLEGSSPFAVDKKLREVIGLEEIGYEDFSRGDPERVGGWLERLIFGRLSDG